MPTVYVSSVDVTDTVVGGMYNLYDFDTLFVQRDTDLAAPNGFAVILRGAQIGVFVEGSLVAGDTAIASAVGAAEDSVFIAETGFVAASPGVELDGSAAVLRNAGTIAGFALGARMEGPSATVQNLGLISGGIAGVNFLGAQGYLGNSGEIAGTVGVLVQASGAVIANSGRITANREASLELTGGIVVDDATTFALDNSGTIEGVGLTALTLSAPVTAGQTLVATILNTGTIAATSQPAILVVPRSGVASEVRADLTNAGEIRGAVLLGGGADLYAGEGGRISGQVTLGNGNDTAIGGAFADRFAGGAGNDELDGGGGDDVLLPGAGSDVVDGGAGSRDLLDYLGAGAVNVSLALGEASGSDAQGDILAGVEWLAGGNFNDILAGDAFANTLFGRSGNDLLSGDAGNDLLVADIGNDTLVGGSGVDVLRGGVGADLFRFLAATDSGTVGAPRDRIMDFVRAQVDRIDVATIDANGALAGNQAFGFIGAAAFTAAGQIRSQVINGNTFVFGNTDANLATSEFSLLVIGAVPLVAGDFIL